VTAATWRRRRCYERPVVTRLVLLVLLCVAACGGGGGSPLERDVEKGLAAQLAVDIDRVSCSGDPATACQAKVGDQWLAIAVVPAQGGGVAWELTGVVVALAPVERYIEKELAEIGHAVKVDCGSRVRTVTVGERVTCSLGALGAAWATIVDDEGAVDIEIAIGGDAVRARSEDVDVAGLDELSAALDLGAVSGEPPDEEGGEGGGSGPPVDAGAAP
jgi:hypothetical protein